MCGRIRRSVRTRDAAEVTRGNNVTTKLKFHFCRRIRVLVLTKLTSEAGPAGSYTGSPHLMRRVASRLRDPYEVSRWT